MFRPFRFTDETTTRWEPVADVIHKRIGFPFRTFINFDHLHPSLTNVPVSEGIKPETYFLKVSSKIRLRVARLAAMGSEVKGTVVMVGGKGGTIEDYQPIANSYARAGYQVIVYDARGHGFSTHMDEDMNKVHVNSPNEFIGDLRKLLKDFVLPRQQGPLLLVGHSMGAAVILVGIGKKRFTADKIVLLAPMIKALRAPSGVKGYGARALSAAHKLTFHGKRYMGTHRPNGIGVSAAWVNSYYVLTQRLLRKLPMIAIPTTLVVAENDEAVSGEEAIKFCWKKIAGFSDAAIHILPGADHNFNQGFAKIQGSAKADAGDMRDAIIRITSEQPYMVLKPVTGSPNPAPMPG